MFKPYKPSPTPLPNYIDKDGPICTVCYVLSKTLVDFGYQINEYLSSMDTIRGFTGIGGLGPQRIAGNETNNFSFQGLFLSLTLHASFKTLAVFILRQPHRF